MNTSKFYKYMLSLVDSDAVVKCLAYFLSTFPLTVRTATYEARLERKLKTPKFHIPHRDQSFTFQLPVLLNNLRNTKVSPQWLSHWGLSNCFQQNYAHLNSRTPTLVFCLLSHFVMLRLLPFSFYLKMLYFFLSCETCGCHCYGPCKEAGSSSIRFEITLFPCLSWFD